MANPENKQIPYESTQKDIRDAIESVATAIGGIAIPSADHVSYDNSGSGLSATDVQNALDEIVSDIPTVNNGTLTIQQNGTSIGSFSANTASNVTANIKTPTADKKTATTEFNTADGGLLSKCQITLVPVQSGSGDPSPDNVRPISGHTEVDLLRDGKNRYIGSPSFDGYTNISSYTLESETLDGNKVYSRSSPWSGAYYPISLKGGVTYTFSAMVKRASSSDAWIYVSSANGGSFSQKFTIGTSWEKISLAFTPTADDVFNIRVESTNNVKIYLSEYQLEKGSTATPYEPYLGHLYQVQIGSTVYGGYVDLVSGVMTVTHGYTDLGSLSWTYSTTYTRFSATLNGYKRPLDNNTPFNAICSAYKVVGSNATVLSENNNSIGANAGSDMVHIKDMAYTDATAFTTHVTGQTLIYELATPLTIQLTPQQIEALVGENNLSTPLSGQSIETNGVEYKELFTFADVKEYVDKKIPDAPTTDGTYTLTATVSSGVATYSWT